MALSSGERQLGCSLLSITKLGGQSCELSVEVAPSNDEESERRVRPKQDKRQALDLKHLSRGVMCEINDGVMSPLVNEIGLPMDTKHQKRRRCKGELKSEEEI